MFRAIVAAVLLVGACSGGPPATDEPQILEAYPNSVADGNEGEFVTLWVPRGTNVSAYQLADETARARLPELNTTGCRTITLSRTPGLTRQLTNRTVRPLPDGIRLADDGDRVRLLREGRVIDSLAYDGWAPEGEVFDAASEAWTPLGATDRPVVSAEQTDAEAFVVPDEGGRARELLSGADERILLAGYTLTSQSIVEALVQAHERGVNVRVLVDGSPVGGMSGRGAAALDTLARNGIDVRVIGGDRARYRFHHAKYAVVDDRALVTTENWKPAGVGGAASRGWGVVLSSDAIVEGLTETFDRDTGWHDAIAWDEHDPTITESGRARGAYPTAFEAQSVSVDRAELVVAPDNAADRLHELIAGAEETLWVKQVSVSGREMPLLQALIDAADRGVDVRLLLSSAWYVEEENSRLARWLEEQADRHELPLEVRLAEPEGAFDRLHAKGIIADDSVVVGSINWTNNSVQNNRETAVILHGEEPTSYFRSVYAADWTGEDDSPMPIGLLAVVVIAAVLAIAFARTVRFRQEWGATR